jgi:hypothetical protein
MWVCWWGAVDQYQAKSGTCDSGDAADVVLLMTCTERLASMIE